MANFVQRYSSTDLNGPGPATGVAGSLTGILDVVLTGNYTTASVTSITESGTTYNMVLAVANTTIISGAYIVVAGGSPSGVNGTWPITVIDSTHVSFIGPGGLGTITGTITYAKAGLGWTKPWSKTNVSVYQSTNTNSGAYPLYNVRVDDSNVLGTLGGAKEAAVRGWQTMTSVDDFSGAGFASVAQQVNGLCWRKSTTADATARSWWIIGDNRFFYLFINSDNSLTAGRIPYFFGAFDSYKSGETTGCVLAGSSTFNSGNPALAATAVQVSALYSFLSPTTGLYFARSFSGAGGSIPGSIITPVATNSALLGVGNSNNSGIDYPSPLDGGLIVNPIYLGESSTSGPRARLPGAYNHGHSTIPCNDGDLVTNVIGLSGVTLQMFSIQAANSPGAIFIDKTGPW